MPSAAVPLPPPSNTKQSSEQNLLQTMASSTFPPGSFSLRAGPQVLNLIKIRMHKPPAPNRSVSQSCQVEGWCQGRGGDLVCEQDDAPWGHSLGDCSPHCPSDSSLCPSSTISPAPAQLCSSSELEHSEHHLRHHCPKMS